MALGQPEPPNTARTQQPPTPSPLSTGASIAQRQPVPTGPPQPVPTGPQLGVAPRAVVHQVSGGPPVGSHAAQPAHTPAPPQVLAPQPQPPAQPQGRLSGSQGRRQLSQGGPSAPGPCTSPGMPARDTRASQIEVPVESTSRPCGGEPRAAAGPQGPSQLGPKKVHETATLKIMSKETGQISEDVKEVREKVDALWAHLQESERERITLLHHDLVQKSREVQAARDSLEAKDAIIVDRERQLAEATSRFRDAEQQLQVEAAAGQQARQELQRCQGLLSDGAPQAEAQAILVAECDEKARTITELQLELQRVGGECNTFKVRQGTLEDEIDKKTTENAELRAELSLFASERSGLQEQLQRQALEGGRGSAELQAQLRLKDEQCGQLHERLGAQMAALKRADQEKAELERQLSEAVMRCQSLEGHGAHEEELRRKERELSEREAQMSQQVAAVEALHQQRDEFEQQRQVAEGDLERQRREMERQARDNREQCRREAEQGRSRLQQELAAFDQQRQMAEQDLERQRQEMERQAKDNRHRGGAADDKEARTLRQSVQDQKTAIFDLQGQLSREQTLSTFITPGEFMKMAKRELAPLNVHENGDLKLKVSALETEVQVARRRGDAAWKHLPATAREAAEKELMEPPPPTSPAHAGA